MIRRGEGGLNFEVMCPLKTRQDGPSPFLVLGPTAGKGWARPMISCRLVASPPGALS